MRLRAAFVQLDRTQRKTFLASFLGWTLDAFDFFLLTFVVVRIAHDFHRAILEVAFAITLTLALRPLGALIFGAIADRYGRRVPLMIDVALFSLFELATAFSPNFTFFLVMRALFGIAMGGEWGLGAALAMESLPAKARGLFSGILQEGYMVGYLLAGLAFYFVYRFTPWGWRGLFVIGVLPALLIFYIRAHVPESPTWLAQRALRALHPPRVAIDFRGIAADFTRQWPLYLYTILFMTAFNFMSHGTQDLYATFLQKQHGFDPGQVALLSTTAAVGAILGGILSGALSQRFGRRPAIIVAAVLGMLVIPLWALSQTELMLALGAFAMQFMVQGAWGVIPAHLNELSPPSVRGTFPGFTYQIGNFFSAGAAQLEAAFAGTHFALVNGNADYAKAMAAIAFIVLAAVLVFTLLGYLVRPENRDAIFTAPA